MKGKWRLTCLLETPGAEASEERDAEVGAEADGNGSGAGGAVHR